MNVILVALGSHGDVHPFLGIGLALRARGHRVRIIANPHFADLIERVGFEFLPAGTAQEYQDLAKDPALWKRIHGLKLVMQSLGKTVCPVYEAIAARNEPGQTVVAASSLALGARVAQDHLGIPTATVHLQPSILFSAISPPKLSSLYMPPWMPLWLRRAQLRIIDWMLDPFIMPGLNAFRCDLGLPPVRRIMREYLNSPTRVIGLFPDWYAPPAADWPPQVRLTGFPLYDERETAPLSDELMKFLDTGDPPIAFTPGSAMWTGERFFAQAAEACRILGRRGLLLSRHRDHFPTDLPQDVLPVDYAPFSRLLPRCAAIVHHGGIGTSAQAMAAGIPQLIVPHAHDQPDNAQRLIRLGIARKVEPRRFVAKNIARQLVMLLESPSVKENCRQIASRLIAADPIQQTCDLIEELARATWRTV